MEDEPSQHAVVYSRWTLDDGWTEPVDVVLSPLKNYAQVLGVQMDDEGWIHLLFYGGSDERQHLLCTKAPATWKPTPRRPGRRLCSWASMRPRP
ncbi:MAG: hypothetical protein R2851_20050 [Caldilineaceae bacterium]